jgi:potassium-transporting ATPase KdpC subunit
MYDLMLGALRVSLVTWVLCGLVYPLVLTGLAQWLMPSQANGGLVMGERGEVIGARLIGQDWQGPERFHGRPSATRAADPQDPDKTLPTPYNAASSAASNLGPASKALRDRLSADRASLQQAQPELAGKPLPADMLTASASGLDPDISPANALLQAPRVARARGVPASEIEALVAQHVAGRMLGIFGEPRVNVLDLNLALERRFTTHGQAVAGGSFPRDPALARTAGK